MFKPSFLIAGLLIVLTCCQQKEEEPLTKEEVHDFAKKIEISIDKREPGMLNEAVDEKILSKKIGIGSGINSKSMQAGLKKGMAIGNKIVESISSKGTYSLIKEYEKDKVHHIIFRLYDNGMLNYHDFELARSKGQPKIADVYIYMTGEDLSETLKNLFAQFKDNAEDSWFSRLPNIRTLLNKGKHQEALAIYNNIPEEAKKARVFQITHIDICSGLSDEQYEKAIAEYETLYPNEPNMQLLMIDGYILRKDYAKALHAVNELDKMIDKDPLLDFYRAVCYKLMGDYAKKTECLERLVKNIPDMEEGILELIADYLAKEEFEKAKPLVDKYRNTSSFDQSTLTTFLSYYPGYNKKYGGE